jgi:hypothetical protein
VFPWENPTYRQKNFLCDETVLICVYSFENINSYFVLHCGEGGVYHELSPHVSPPKLKGEEYDILENWIFPLSRAVDGKFRRAGFVHQA